MDNKAKILKTAIELFASRGFDAVGIQEITQNAEITKPTLYHYFGSKSGLLDFILEEKFSLLLDELKIAADYKGDLPYTMENIVKVFFRFAVKNKTFYRMYLSMILSTPESTSMKAAAPYEEKMYKYMEKLFILASKDHGNMKGRDKRYAITFLGMINNYIVLYLKGFIELNDKTIFDAVHQFSHGIYS